VILLGAGVLAFFFLPWRDRSPVKSVRYRGWLYRAFLIAFAISFLALGYLGLQPATAAYTNAARALFAISYFAFFILMPWYSKADHTRPVPDRVT
jgi:ubiquinol-cytochrome c reductase cytochrome b subunit